MLREGRGGAVLEAGPIDGEPDARPRVVFDLGVVPRFAFGEPGIELFAPTGLFHFVQRRLQPGSQFRIASGVFERLPAELRLHGVAFGCGMRGEAIPLQRSIDHLTFGRTHCVAEHRPADQGHHEQQCGERETREQQKRPANAAKAPGFQVREHGLRVRVAMPRVGGEALAHDGREPGIHAGHLPMHGRRRRRLDQRAIGSELCVQRSGAEHGGRARLRPVRGIAREHAVHHGTERVDVPTGIGGGFQIRLFRSHVEERAQRGGTLVREAGLAEVREARMAILIEQHVRGLQVAVENALIVCVNQALRHVAKDGHGFLNRERPIPKLILERAVLHVLHHVVRRLGFPPDLEELDHVAIVEEVAELLDFAGECRPVGAAAPRVILDGDLAAAVAVDRDPDLAVGPFAEEGFLLVARHAHGWPHAAKAQGSRLVSVVLHHHGRVPGFRQRR